MRQERRQLRKFPVFCLLSGKLRVETGYRRTARFTTQSGNFSVSGLTREIRRNFRDLAPYVGEQLRERRGETPGFRLIRRIVSAGGGACPIDFGSDGREVPGTSFQARFKCRTAGADRSRGGAGRRASMRGP